VSVGFDWAPLTLAVGGRRAAAAGAAPLANEHELSAVIDLRAEVRGEERALQAVGVTLLHLPTPNHHAIALRMLAEDVALRAVSLNGNVASWCIASAASGALRCWRFA
jgi:hypothetical protein